VESTCLLCGIDIVHEEPVVQIETVAYGVLGLQGLLAMIRAPRVSKSRMDKTMPFTTYKLQQGLKTLGVDWG
jgi:hypothetical protein